MRRGAVAPCPAGLLIELARVEVEMEEHDVANVGQIDAFAECRRGNHNAKHALAKEAFDLEPLGVWHLAMVEHDLVAEMLAQALRDLGDLRPRVAVDNALLRRVVLRRKRLRSDVRAYHPVPPSVGNVKVLSHRRIDHPAFNAQIVNDPVKRFVGGGCRQCEHRRIAQRRNGRRKPRISGPVALTRQDDALRQ